MPDTVFELKGSRFRYRQKGTTTVEFAIVLPLFLFLTIGSIQLFRYVIVANAVETAVMEGARKAILVGSTNAQIETVTKQVLDRAGLVQYSITVDRIGAAGTKSDITIQAQLSLTGNGFLAPTFGNSWTVLRRCSICCE